MTVSTVVAHEVRQAVPVCSTKFVGSKRSELVIDQLA